MESRICYQDELKRCGLKTTKSRKAIIEILMDGEQPITAEQIYMLLLEKKIDINLSTVYRTLETLEKNELVTRLNLDEERNLFEYNKAEHRHYLVCLNCKKIITIHGCPLHNYEKSVEEDTEFQITGHKLYLYGYCKTCKNIGTENPK